jgi:hypothetical protein
MWAGFICDRLTRELVSAIHDALPPRDPEED